MRRERTVPPQVKLVETLSTTPRRTSRTAGTRCHWTSGSKRRSKSASSRSHGNNLYCRTDRAVRSDKNRAGRWLRITALRPDSSPHRSRRNQIVGVLRQYAAVVRRFWVVAFEALLHLIFGEVD